VRGVPGGGRRGAARLSTAASACASLHVHVAAPCMFTWLKHVMVSCLIAWHGCIC
jgi:hypothetical protein